MTNLFEAFLWRVAIIAGIIAVSIAVVMLVRAIGAWRNKVRSRSRKVTQTPPVGTGHPASDAGTLPIPRRLTPARRPAARDIAQNGIFHDAA